MWDEGQNLRKADFGVRESLNGAEQTWVIGQLVAHNGVNGAQWCSAPLLRLSVEYDADRVTSGDLLDLLELYGLHARPVRLTIAAA